MLDIKNLNEIPYEENPSVVFTGTVVDFITEGDGDKKPFKLLLRLEESGEQIQAFSWSWTLLDAAKNAATSMNVFEFAGVANKYKDEPQVRLSVIKDLGYLSTKKVNPVGNTEEIKKELLEQIKIYVPQSSIYYPFLESFVIQNENFWKWPAATKIHHAYPGGLAKHTLNVLKNAINIWKVYNGENLRIDLIVAGAILHDIGKLQEYNPDGTRTVYGDLVPHIISGYEMLVRKAVEKGIDPETNMDFVMLKHVVLSHHEKLEWGSPTKPAILEALVVARADCLDANIETAEKFLETTELNKETDKIMPLDGTRLLKWHY